MSRLRQFAAYTRKVFHLQRLAARITDTRPNPDIPTQRVWWDLWFGAVCKVPSFFQLQSESRRQPWRRTLGGPRSISHDTLGYVSARMVLEPLRTALVTTNKLLKRNKAFRRNQINGLLALNVDANEQFTSRSRCCSQCRQRQVKVKNAAGQEEEVTEYYHVQVYAQLSGPHWNTVLDVEPLRPGEEERAAALRLLGRLRRHYGVRFFQVVVVDAWYAKGPFLKAVAALGWAVVVVLKQEEYTIYQEALALTQGPPTEEFEQDGRHVRLWEVRDLTFSSTYGQPVRVVRSQEEWTEVQIVGGRKKLIPKQSHWLWVATEALDPQGPRTIWNLGHGRWRIENHAFNVLTKHWHLQHCAHHDPVSIMACLLITLLAFNLFHAFVFLNGKLYQQGKITLQELRLQLYRAIEQGLLLPWFSG
jgi:alkylhydroperoxidase family enzyme